MRVIALRAVFDHPESSKRKSSTPHPHTKAVPHTPEILGRAYIGANTRSTGRDCYEAIEWKADTNSAVPSIIESADGVMVKGLGQLPTVHRRIPMIARGFAITGSPLR